MDVEDSNSFSPKAQRAKQSSLKTVGPESTNGCIVKATMEILVYTSKKPQSTFCTKANCTFSCSPILTYHVYAVQTLST